MWLEEASEWRQIDWDLCSCHQWFLLFCACVLSAWMCQVQAVVHRCASMNGCRFLVFVIHYRRQQLILSLLQVCLNHVIATCVHLVVCLSTGTWIHFLLEFDSNSSNKQNLGLWLQSLKTQTLTVTLALKNSMSDQSRLRLLCLFQLTGCSHSSICISKASCRICNVQLTRLIKTRLLHVNIELVVQR